MEFLTSIPSPSPEWRSWSFPTFTLFGQEFTLTIHAYAICILLGIVIAVLLTNFRLTRRGGEPWIVFDILLWALPLGIIGARAYHVLTHPGDYFFEGHEWWNPTVRNAIWNVWDGGIAIFGALIGGGIGAWIACRLAGIRFWSFADALAPGLLIAQAVGRLGNWFNQELFGQPTDLPWGLDVTNPTTPVPAGLPADTLYHPTFLYELIWNVIGAGLIIVVLERRFNLRWGRAFAVYLIWYGAGRIVWESIRIDPSEIFFGIRTNVWTAVLAVVLGIVLLLISRNRHTGLEPSVYRDGVRFADREPAVESDEVAAASARKGRVQAAEEASATSKADPSS